MFTKILIANRGEIAVRIIRACKEMGIATVAVFSDADRDALHTLLADESICIGKAQVKDSYLNMTAILSAAISTGAEAIHPGYGLLSENSKFADLCAQCNIKFIGPSSDIIAKMGDKDVARKTMVEAGVPVIPGSDIVSNIETAKREADRIGYPLLIKARAGGGGKGIRLATEGSGFDMAFTAASAEAMNAFGDGSCYLEKYLSPVKHIEVQILCDSLGNVVCLGERECSMQRKNQKLIEESPSTAITPSIRKKMIDASVKAAKAVGYENAGTIEYLFDTDKNFYFMEMNTRLQVEHPVTEMVTGYDIVKWQIRIAAGMELGFTQKDVRIEGHAIECRINAEDSTRDFAPSCGKITLFHVPGGPWVRFDTAIYQNYSIPPFYDSMIGKLIVFAKEREEAIRKMNAALCELVIEGVCQNSEYQIELLNDPDFVNGSYHTNFIELKGANDDKEKLL
jgi:acetyl-CoA carboxylase biotin carboxylase subunit